MKGLAVHTAHIVLAVVLSLSVGNIDQPQFGPVPAVTDFEAGTLFADRRCECCDGRGYFWIRNDEEGHGVNWGCGVCDAKGFTRVEVLRFMPVEDLFVSNAMENKP